MKDDDLFHDFMRSLGVSPLRHEDRRGGENRRRGEERHDGTDRRDSTDRRGSTDRRDGKDRGKNRRLSRPPPSEDLPPDEEDALFLAFMDTLSRTPDKDRAPSSAAAKPELRRIKRPKGRGAEPEAKLDLHGHNSTEAVVRLERFVVTSSKQRMKVVLVVTGKGLRSERGVSVLKETVERWLRMRGKQWVRAFSEAPRGLGGRGAYIFFLHP